MPATDVIVIGGGLAGLSSALALAEAGLRVSLLEKRSRLGGRATSYLLADGEYVDNCQHVTLGCCTNLDDFYRRVGAADKIRWYRRLLFFDRDGNRGTIKASPLPAPLHLAPSFAMFPSLTWADKQAISRALLYVARAGGQPPDVANATMLEWLHRHRQPAGAIERFWRVILVSALNEELNRAGARYGVDVFWKAFLANHRGFEVGVPSVPLADLYDGCRGVIERRGGDVRTSAGVRQIIEAQGRVAAVQLEDGTTAGAEFFVAAVPHNRLLRILPPRALENDAAFVNLKNLRDTPITGVHIWFDRPVMTEPFVTLLDHTVQWIFNKSMLYGPPSEDNALGREPSHRGSRTATSGVEQYLQLVISASYDLMQRSREEIVGLCRMELSEILPLTRKAQVRKAIVIKESAATFSPEPGCDRWRPSQRCAFNNLFLAGDWTQTGWPATMEGAVRSGYLAAECVLTAAGRPRKLLQPDLPPRGLARLWTRKREKF
ncbi:MAG TPA: hydroxysqualene dehydroxylase HpnE [Acidobacteriota bacterium]|jgi:zeta-carotene desaturase